MAEKKPTKPPVKALTDEMRARIDADQQRKKDIEELARMEIEEDLRLEAEAAYQAEVKEKLRKELLPELQTRPITIDLPSHAPYIRIDGSHIYYPDQTYQVDKATYETLKEIMWKAWWSEEQLHGNKDDNHYRRKMNRILSARGVQVEQNN